MRRELSDSRRVCPVLGLLGGAAPRGPQALATCPTPHRVLRVLKPGSSPRRFCHCFPRSHRSPVGREGSGLGKPWGAEVGEPTGTACPSEQTPHLQEAAARGPPRRRWRWPAGITPSAPGGRPGPAVSRAQGPSVSQGGGVAVSRLGEHPERRGPGPGGFRDPRAHIRLPRPGFRALAVHREMRSPPGLPRAAVGPWSLSLCYSNALHWPRGWTMPVTMDCVPFGALGGGDWTWITPA